MPIQGADPAHLLDFIELSPFTKCWRQLELDDEGDLTELQMHIMQQPKKGDVIPGTKSIRKVRFAPERWHTGKRGGVRVWYVHRPDLGIVILCYVYAKNELENVSQSVKNYLNQLVDEMVAELKQRKSAYSKKRDRR